jgi:hypothetical protein
MRNLALLALAILLVIDGCTHESQPVASVPGQVPDPPIMPLKVGNLWKWRQTHFDTLGNTTDVHYDSLYIFRDSVVNGERWYLRNHEGHNWGYSNRADGLWFRFFSPNNPTDERLMYKYPAAVGDAYPYLDVVVQGPAAYLVTERNITQVTSIGTVISIPAGTFTCQVHQVVPRDPYGWRMVLFLSPGYGLVKSDYYYVLTTGREVCINTDELVDATTIK